MFSKKSFGTFFVRYVKLIGTATMMKIAYPLIQLLLVSVLTACVANPAPATATVLPSQTVQPSPTKTPTVEPTDTAQPTLTPTATPLPLPTIPSSPVQPI